MDAPLYMTNPIIKGLFISHTALSSYKSSNSIKGTEFTTKKDGMIFFKHKTNTVTGLTKYVPRERKREN